MHEELNLNSGNNVKTILALLQGADTIQTVFFTLQTMSVSHACSEKISKSCCIAAHDGASIMRLTIFTSM